MNQRKKSKFRRRINRMKNKMQYLRKRVCVPVTCFLLCFSLIAVTLFATKQQAYATGVEELFYYTYWDLISGLFAETGYQFSSPDSYYAKPDRASGKDVWDNFCTWVENKAKVLSLPVEVVNDTIFKELENLPNVVNAAGVTMSEKLSELLAKVLPTFSDDDGLSDYGDQDATYTFIRGIMGITDEYSWSGGTYSLYDLWTDLKNGYELNIIKYGDYTLAFATSPDYADFKIQLGSWGYAIYYKNVGGTYSMFRNHTGYTANSSTLKISSQNLESISSVEPVWVMKKGKFTVADGTALSDMARVKVKEKTDDKDGVYVPGVGWKTKWNVWDDVLDGQGATDKEKDEWWLRYHVNELLKDLPDSGDVDSDDEKRRKQDNEKDKLPVVLPIPFKPGKDTEKDTETETESESESEKDTEPAPGPIPKPNPTEDGSEDDTESQKHIQDVITNAGGSSGGNWKKLFPFCIPWDIMTLIKSMNAEKKAPHFKYEHTFKGINYTFSIDVDMSDYWKYIKIFRWGMTIFFIIGLFFLTVKFTTFVHRGS